MINFTLLKMMEDTAKDFKTKAERLNVLHNNIEFAQELLGVDDQHEKPCEGFNFKTNDTTLNTYAKDSNYIGSRQLKCTPQEYKNIFIALLTEWEKEAIELYKSLN